MIDYYIGKDDEQKTFRVELDLACADTAPDHKRSWLMWLFVKCKKQLENGMCDEKEHLLLEQMRNELCDAVESGIKGQYVGTKEHEGWMEIYFYAPSAKGFENIAAEVMRTYAIYAYEYGSTMDAKWEHYFLRLSPDSLMHLQMQARRTKQELLAEGDDLSRPHDLEHYLFFQTEAQAIRCAERMEAEGYEFRAQVDAEGDYAHGVILAKTGMLDDETLRLSDLELFDAARREHGLYRGWNTELAR